MALAFPRPLASDYVLENPVYATPAWTLTDIQDLIDYCYDAYPTIECLRADLQPTAFRLAVAHEAEQSCTSQQGYGGVVRAIKNRNDSVEFSLSKEGWALENSLPGARLLKLLRANCGTGIYVSKGSKCCDR
jgi:hypothetical protein